MRKKNHVKVRSSENVGWTKALVYIESLRLDWTKEANVIQYFRVRHVRKYTIIFLQTNFARHRKAKKNQKMCATLLEFGICAVKFRRYQTQKPFAI